MKHIKLRVFLAIIYGVHVLI